MTISARAARTGHATDARLMQTAAPVVPSTGRLRPLGLDDVVINGGFWGRRQQVNRTATLEHIGHWLEHEGWLANFDLAAGGGSMSGRRGREFSDSEVYKYLEALAWELGREHDANLASQFDAVVARVAAAQDTDGYIGTQFGRAGQAARYSDLEWGHELYCMGHLMQAAVARTRTGHLDDALVRVALRAAHHVSDEFGPDGAAGICGHPEIEVALAELGRAVQERRFIDQASLFVDRRGHRSLADIEFGRAYYQDDVPVREADVFRGHAVRANYLAAGAVDVAVENDDRDLLEAIERQWERTAARRTYLTGGQGSRHQDEGFGEDYQLPPDRAYSETCAGIASIMVSWRLLLQTGDSRHADMIERNLFNVVATSPGDDGRSFYYSNTLHRRIPGELADPHAASARAESSLRAPWFEVSCCPPNVARTFSSLSAYCATASSDGVQIHQYATARVTADLGDGEVVELMVVTQFPSEGRVAVEVLAAPARAWDLQMRVPRWSRSARLTDASGDVRQVEPGTITISGPSAGEHVVLDLDVTPHFLWPDDRIDAVRGCVAVQRGPEVMAIESTDLPGDLTPQDLSRIRVDTAFDPIEVDGRVEVNVRVLPRESNQAWPYRTGELHDGVRPHVTNVALVPYHGWASRGPSAMRVWIPAV